MSGAPDDSICTLWTAAHTEPVPDDDARLSGVVVPDDISALARDIATYRREVRRYSRVGRGIWWGNDGSTD